MGLALQGVVISRRHDILRLAALIPLLLLAAIGRRDLRVDLENAAMKSEGTPTAAVAALEAAEFGRDPLLVLLATPRSAELLNDDDRAELQAWVAQLKSRPEVTQVESAFTDHTGELCLGVHVRSAGGESYAGSAGSLQQFARTSVPPTYSLSISGNPAVELAIGSELTTERKRILPIIIAALAAVLLLVYRSPLLVLGALAGPLLGVFLLEGVQGLLGLSIDPVSALLGPAVLTVGVASGVHVVERYLLALGREPSVQAASRSAARELRLPFLLAVATTITGFLGLLASPIPALRHFGLLASLGTGLAVGITLVELPALLRLLHRPALRHGAEDKRSALQHARLVARRAPSIALGCAALALLAFAFLGKARVDNDPLHVLSSENSVRRESEFIAQRLGGSEVFGLLLPPWQGAPGPFTLAAVVSRVTALDGVVAAAGRPRRSPDGYYLLPFLMAPGGSSHHEQVFAQAEAVARDVGWQQAAVTGLAVQITRDSRALVLGQREGLLLATLGLWLVMALGFRSWKLALLGLVPNLLPMLLVNGALGAMDRPLSVASTMIGAVMLGLIVDDTIHLLHTWRGMHGNGLQRLTRTLIDVRRPIVITTVVLCVGFSATLAGELQPTREFGGLALATLLLALASTLLLVPALLSLPARVRQARPNSAPIAELSTS